VPTTAEATPAVAPTPPALPNTTCPGSYTTCPGSYTTCLWFLHHLPWLQHHLHWLQIPPGWFYDNNCCPSPNNLWADSSIVTQFGLDTCGVTTYQESNAGEKLFHASASDCANYNPIVRYRVLLWLPAVSVFYCEHWRQPLQTLFDRGTIHYDCATSNSGFVLPCLPSPFRVCKMFYTPPAVNTAETRRRRLKRAYP
jgi:hypothetical protein